MVASDLIPCPFDVCKICEFTGKVRKSWLYWANDADDYPWRQARMRACITTAILNHGPWCARHAQGLPCDNYDWWLNNGMGAHP